jgi:hypothetical protein
MKWTLTTKNQTHGVATDIAKYQLRVTRSGNIARVSVENMTAGNVREGRFLIPIAVARMLGNALLVAASGDGDPVNVVFTIDETKVKKS